MRGPQGRVSCFHELTRDFAVFQKKPKGPPKRRASKTKIRAKKKDPVFVNGERPRPMYVDYKDLDLLTKLTNRQGKIVGRRKSGCTAVSQHAVTLAVKRARYMALLPYVAD
jgi:small subunit ribosomal protein S18